MKARGVLTWITSVALRKVARGKVDEPLRCRVVTVSLCKRVSPAQARLLLDARTLSILLRHLGDGGFPMSTFKFPQFGGRCHKRRLENDTVSECACSHLCRARTKMSLWSNILRNVRRSDPRAVGRNSVLHVVPYFWKFLARMILPITGLPTTVPAAFVFIVVFVNC